MTVQDAKELGMDAAADFKNITCPFYRQDKDCVSNLIEGRRLFYYDSLGDLSELLHENGEFIGFASC